MNSPLIKKELFQIGMLLLLFAILSSSIKAQGCDFLENDVIQLNIANQQTDGAYTQQYALTNAAGIILDIESQPLFSAQTAGNYMVYALNYETSSSLSGFSIGNNITAIGGSCFDITSIVVNVCVCSTNCHSTDGTVVLSIANTNTGVDFTQSYALTDETGNILNINTNPTTLNPLFSGVSVGNYQVYALNYETASGVGNYLIGNNVNNVTGTCLDIEGPICYNICPPPQPTGCQSEDGTVRINSSGFNRAAGYTQSYALVDASGIIQSVKHNPSNTQPLFVAVPAGTYEIYAINYETASGINNLTVGDAFNTISGTCLDISNAISYQVCPCPFTSCNSTDGVISVNMSGQNTDAAFTQAYALTDTFGVILQTITAPASTNSLFTSVAAGYYHAYAINYETVSGITGFSAGGNIDNVSGSCFDITGALCYQVCEDIPLSCGSEDGTVRINSMGFNRTAGYTQSYALVDTNGVIQRIKHNPSSTQPLFVAVPAGTYQVYALNYETASGINNLTIGNAFNTVTGTCLDISNSIDYMVCPCPFTSCNSTDGVISVNISGQNTDAAFTQAYALTDTFGVILQVTTNPTSTDSLFTSITSGYYHIYAINYETANSLSGLKIGSNIDLITEHCFDITGALCYQVCNDNYDFGDLPDSSDSTKAGDYQTLLANNGPRHLIIPGLFLGDTIDMEVDGIPDALAEGDGIDEDGLVIFSSLDIVPGMNFRLPLNYVNTTGDTAFVAAWIDWNGDGDFEEVNEMVLAVNDGNGTTPISNRWEITIPSDAVTGQDLGLRIRISLQDNMTPYGVQPNGEVEDYLLSLDCPQICLPIVVEKNN